MCDVDCNMCRWCGSDTALIAGRVAADTGVRHELDDVIEFFGMTRAELEADDQ